jgi:hypothetical protein
MKRKVLNILSILISKLESFWNPETKQFYLSKIMEGACLPNHFLSEFELQRLSITEEEEFGEIGTLETQMMVASFVVIKIFVFHVLLKAPTHCGIKSTELAEHNLLAIASVIYEVCIQMFRTIPSNENTRLDNIKEYGVVLSEKLDVRQILKSKSIKKRKVSAGDSEIIAAMLKPEELSYYFENTGFVREIKVSLTEFIAKLCQPDSTKPRRKS